MNRHQEFRAMGAVQIAAALASCRHPHNPGALYTHEQIVDASIAIATLLISKLEALEKDDNPMLTVERDDPDPELPKAGFPEPAAPPTPPVAASPAPAGPITTSSASGASQGNVEPPAPKPDPETVTAPQSPTSLSRTRK